MGNNSSGPTTACPATVAIHGRFCGLHARARSEIHSDERRTATRSGSSTGGRICCTRVRAEDYQLNKLLRRVSHCSAGGKSHACEFGGNSEIRGGFAVPKGKAKARGEKERGRMPRSRKAENARGGIVTGRKTDGLRRQRHANGKMEKEWSIAPRVFLEVSSLGRGQARGSKYKYVMQRGEQKGEKGGKMNENWSSGDRPTRLC